MRSRDAVALHRRGDDEHDRSTRKNEVGGGHARSIKARLRARARARALWCTTLSACARVSFLPSPSVLHSALHRRIASAQSANKNSADASLNQQSGDAADGEVPSDERSRISKIWRSSSGSRRARKEAIQSGRRGAVAFGAVGLTDGRFLALRGGAHKRPEGNARALARSVGARECRVRRHGRAQCASTRQRRSFCGPSLRRAYHKLANVCNLIAESSKFQSFVTVVIIIMGCKSASGRKDLECDEKVCKEDLRRARGEQAVLRRPRGGRHGHIHRDRGRAQDHCK